MEQQTRKLFSNYIVESIKMPVADADALSGQMRYAKYFKGELLHRAGEVCDSIWFIGKGIGRYLSILDSGKEGTPDFFAEKDFLTDIASFNLQIPSQLSLQALTDMHTIVLEKSVVDWLIANIDGLADTMRWETERSYEMYYESLCHRLKGDYAASYKILLARIPGIESAVSQKVFASYLGITNVHLSRISSAFR